ncbi:MAG: GtrA family protein [Clostridia bacterium]|nr:GtrA family protein [Clostridia bacterium]
MVEKIKALFLKYKELILYVFFGGLTTVVSWGSYFLLTELAHAHYQAAQWISWVCAVVFAFVVNKLFVFEDKDTSKRGLFRQIWQFVSVRIASGVVESALLFVMVDLIHIGDGISKIVVSVVTVILNYVASKLLIFRKQSNEEKRA